jgi:SAM-dependent methyltransferase
MAGSAAGVTAGLGGRPGLCRRHGHNDAVTWLSLEFIARTLDRVPMQPLNTETLTQFVGEAERAEYYAVADDNLLNHPVVRELTAEMSAVGASVLDVGCGSGAIATQLGRGCRYWGGDFEIQDSQRLETAVCDATVLHLDSCQTYPFDDRSFDYVISLWCLEHLADPQSMLSECVRVLKTDGTLFLIFPNYENPFRRCPSWWCARGGDDSLVSALRPLRLDRLACQGRRRAAYLLRQSFRQLRLTLSSRYLSFWINEDPAIKHLPWARDRDAIHIVNGQSVERFLRSQGMRITFSSRRISTGLPIVDCFSDWSPETVIRARRIASNSGKSGN